MLDLNTRNPLRVFRCDSARFFNNTKPSGTVIAGWQWDSEGHYDEPETLAEDAFMLWLMRRRG